MAIKVAVTGSGHFAGAETNLTSYTVTEDGTPIDASDSSGGVGQIDFGVLEDPAADGTILLLNDTITLTDDGAGRGTAQGTVISVSINAGQANVTADARLGGLVIQKTANPFTGTLNDAFIYYLGLGGITTGIYVDPSVASRAVTLPGWTGNLWDYVKMFLTSQQVELTLLNGVITVRPLRTVTVSNANNASIGLDVHNSDLAQTIECYYYNNVRKVNTMVYPAAGWTQDMEILQVDAGKTVTYELPINVSLESLVQPTCVLNVGPFYTGPSSVYCVAGNDGLPIPVAQWKAGGGSLKVDMGKNHDTIIVTITGSNVKQYAPYRIAVAPNASDSYSALRIMGTGVFFEKKMITIPTGAPFSKAPTEIGATIENPFINSISDAYSAAILCATKYAAPQQTITVTTASLNQGIGNIAGSRVLYRQAYYRIRSARVTEANVNYEAERDTTFGDVSAVWSGMTFADFGARWAGKRFEDLALIPLWR